jgi:hypothetical protein
VSGDAKNTGKKGIFYVSAGLGLGLIKEKKVFYRLSARLFTKLP